MPRSAGITDSAGVAIVGSAFTILFGALLMLLGSALTSFTWSPTTSAVPMFPVMVAQIPSPPVWSGQTDDGSGAARPV
jgi:hypothetical protein